MPRVVSLIPLREGYPTGSVGDSDYLQLIDSFVSPCLCSLATAVGKDLQWKPLNRKILTCFRDRRKIVKVAAVKTMHKLFSEVVY